MFSSTAFLALPLLASAHFHVLYPIPRSDVDDSEATGPCGGFPVTMNRTSVSMINFPVALEMGHDRSVIQMLLSLGNNPGDNFNITLERTFQQQGEGAFCLPHVSVPQNLNITDGTNATLQVVTDGEGGGGLYVCADITFSSTAVALPSSCVNGTGVTASALPASDANLNANETSADGQPQSGGSASSSGSASPSSTASSSSSSASSEAIMFTAGWSVLGGALIGAVAMMYSGQYS